MSVTPGLGSFNKDKVANKFGIQLKPKGSSQQSLTTSTTKITSTTTGAASSITKNKTVSDFRANNNTNGFSSNTSEPIKKVPDKSLTSKSTSGLVSTSVNNERSDSLTSNVNHSTKKSKEPSPAKSPATAKKSSIISNERAVSPAPSVKGPSVSIVTPPHKTEAQIQHQKDQPLYRRQLSKPIDPTSSATLSTTTSAAGGASTAPLKR
jgi:hypothetical protein